MLPRLVPGGIGLGAAVRAVKGLVLTIPRVLNWLMLRSISRCVPLLPKYPTMIPIVGATCCWILRFQSWTSAFLKFGSMRLGAMLDGVPRSEERRVGKECRSRWSPYH